MAIETLTIAALRGKTSASTSDKYCTTDLLQKGTWIYDITDTTSLDNGNTIVVAPTVPQLTFKRIFDGVETTDYDGLLYKTVNTAERYFTIDSGNQGLWYCDPNDTTSPASPTIIVGYYSPYLRFKRILNRVETTLNEMRNVLTQFNIGETYYTTDFGQEGEWYFAGIDTVSIDNTGTVITSPANPSSSANRVVFKRIYDGYINVKWFGAIGDGNHDDIDAIQTAINWVTKTEYTDIWYPGDPGDPNANPPKPPIPPRQYKFGGGTVFFPEGVYRITKNILVGANCRLLGVSNEGEYLFPDNININNSTFSYRGSLICADYISSTTDPNYYWTIQSACYYTSDSATGDPDPHLAGDLLQWDSVGADFDTYKITHCPGIIIENLPIRPNPGQFEGGGIKLSGAGSSKICHVQILDATEEIGGHEYYSGASIGIMLSNCYGGISLDHIWMKIDVWGIIIIACSPVQISNTVINGVAGNNLLYPEDEEHFVPRFIRTPSYYNNTLKLNEDVRRGRCGIYAAGSPNLTITSTNWEYIYNGLVLIQTNASLSGLYFEYITKYSIVCASETGDNGFLGTLDANCLTLGAPPEGAANICFFFGQGVFANISGVHPTIFYNFAYPYFATDLFVNNYSDDLVRVISFAKTLLYAKRYYSPDIVFIDESPYGQNYASVYVNPNVTYDSTSNPYPGNDANYGFNETDPLKTFDEALKRVQNQSTVNPVRTIYVKGAPALSESVQYFEGAAYKNLDVVPIQNCDILVTSYATDENNPRGRIYFGNDTLDEHPITAQIGQIELLGNVNLYFRNVDLVCNIANANSSDNRNLSLFGLRNSFSKLTFESNLSIDVFSIYLFNIDMSNEYFLVQANYPIGTVIAKSLLDIKFVNIIIKSGGGLSPYQNGFAELGVDCTQINSYQYTSSGWQYAEIIRNNLP